MQLMCEPPSSSRQPPPGTPSPPENQQRSACSAMPVSPGAMAGLAVPWEPAGSRQRWHGDGTVLSQPTRTAPPRRMLTAGG